ncbi:hypothetical protein [Ferruginibacter albus]|uniref:hypothetical protein n=1 Tax=Ferruginibacter albus TaxID=2875540 RepID=UPI001CC7F80D|nr:hypothetical protein [Ferruginibacter albus]UAY52537.1 hypothetical protein K9M53_02325 [Ferruginibacter albus]
MIKKHTTFFPSSPVTAVGASFGSVSPQAGLKKCAAYFFKETKAAPVQLRSHAGCGGENFKA